jgi:transposase
VAQLGELTETLKRQAQAFAKGIIGEPEQSDLFNDGYRDVVVPVRLKGIAIKRSRRFGDVYLALLLWAGLKFGEFWEGRLERERDGVPWEKVIATLVCARLCEPSSELHIVEDFYRQTALPDLLGVREEQMNKDRLYRALDIMMKHKVDLEMHLSRRAGELFDISNDILLYDMTSTYFEGEAARNPKAARGYSRDHRPDCKQICVAVVVTFDGYPLGYETFAGNTHDSKTVRQIVEAMESRHGAIGRVWVMDRGMVSEENLSWFKVTGRRYLVGTPKSELKRWEADLADASDWAMIREGIEVKLCKDSDNNEEIFILCRSRDRIEKEKAMHELFIVRIEKSLIKLLHRIERAKQRLNRDAINRQIGRILQRNQRASARFDIKLVDDASPAGFHLTYTINQEFDDWAALSEGTYVLRTNIKDWTHERLWKTYVQLTQAEAAFRVQKSELSIRPIWHQREDRVDAHILVCFLAFAMWKTLECWQSKAGLGNSPRTILMEMSRIQSHDVILPTTIGKDIRLRCVTQPDEAQSAILARLGITLPKRMKIPDGLSVTTLH